MKTLLPIVICLSLLSACGAARHPDTATAAEPTAPVAELGKLDARCTRLYNSRGDFMLNARESGFVTDTSGVLFDVQLEPETYSPNMRSQLAGIGRVGFFDEQRGRASLYLNDREDLLETSRLPFVRSISGSRKAVTR